jgi:hypothetical protein
MDGLGEAFQFVGGDHRNRTAGSATHHHDLAILDRAIHQ